MARAHPPEPPDSRACLADPNRASARTSNLSWVKGYADVLGPMEKVSALFAEKTRGADPSEPRYRNALYHLLLTQTSDFRYWGSGVWTDYAREVSRRALAILEHDF